jgi:glycolate oxidase
MFNKITPKYLSAITSIVGADAIFYSDHTVIENYSHDETEDLVYYPEVVVKPKPEQVSALMKFCNEQLIPVTPRGAGTGLAGGALAVNGGFNDIHGAF